MMIYAMSDIHGFLREFEEALAKVDLSGDNRLILLGDYIHRGPSSIGVLRKIIAMQKRYGRNKVLALMGNHEESVLDRSLPLDMGPDGGGPLEDISIEEYKAYVEWMKTLPRYYTNGKQIFVHAGVEESAGGSWEWVTDDYTFTEQKLVRTGKFYMDIIAGHIGTAKIAENPEFHDIYYDGYSHYYIDGTVKDSGVIPVLKIDTLHNKYYCVTEAGDRLILPYDRSPDSSIFL